MHPNFQRLRETLKPLKSTFLGVGDFRGQESDLNILNGVLLDLLDWESPEWHGFKTRSEWGQ